MLDLKDIQAIRGGTTTGLTEEQKDILKKSNATPAENAKRICKFKKENRITDNQ